ncbi:glycosyltransferase family 33 protein [Mixia osmundae IAM 14324]|uniref:Chitobiosyldiphosphodolichol beta-mannosyltransferase n=1 Tax=Mixia osmundae (strain CBS 9802 / IAM 14324 / JCM 22182 / KY 12970) TaxID=764103 RepID=G7E7Y8_MIXOS|nr:glycosyltransferase family 33 protein [Mixia osmundae IAM 14324]KEI38547.1 glycosyltransferase family 33 protein [Mixia osmundae IAM 14324]GAA98948.1 hypothetical protein E5Q_05636 [Mixia osmundae IAM 14324]
MAVISAAICSLVALLSLAWLYRRLSSSPFLYPDRTSYRTRSARQARTTASGTSRPAGRIIVVVLGDIARSPRMTYHANSLLRREFAVTLIGYDTTPLGDDHALLQAKYAHRLDMRPLRPLQTGKADRWLNDTRSTTTKVIRLARLHLLIRALVLASKVLHLSWQLGLQLYRLSVAEHDEEDHQQEYNAPVPCKQWMLVQVPPSLPTLVLVRCIRYLTNTKLCIDWHNTSTSILAQSMGSRNPIVRLAGALESRAGRSADAHLFVTDHMRTVLSTQWKLKGDKRTFYDRPSDEFKRLDACERRQLISRLPVLRELQDLPAGSSPALVVSSTSWTPDEDFGMLLNALSHYEKAVRHSKAQTDRTVTVLPDVLAIITGKGPGKASFELAYDRQSKQEDWRHVRVKTAWLERSDYPLLLGAADLGISLHASSSGLDLPMKVVDMFGARLPVIALNFDSLPELVQDGKNGLTACNALDLADRFITALREFREFPSMLDILRAGITDSRYGAEQARWCQWENEWERVVLPLFQ